jgi:hypothetical protein
MPPWLPEHVIFDASLFLLLHVFLCGALPFNTWDELVKSDQVVICVKDEMKDLLL